MQASSNCICVTLLSPTFMKSKRRLWCSQWEAGWGQFGKVTEPFSIFSRNSYSWSLLCVMILLYIFHFGACLYISILWLFFFISNSQLRGLSLNLVLFYASSNCICVTLPHLLHFLNVDGVWGDKSDDGIDLEDGCNFWDFEAGVENGSIVDLHTAWRTCFRFNVLK